MRSEVIGDFHEPKGAILVSAMREVIIDRTDQTARRPRKQKAESRRQKAEGRKQKSCSLLTACPCLPNPWQKQTSPCRRSAQSCRSASLYSSRTPLTWECECIHDSAAFAVPKD